MSEVVESAKLLAAKAAVQLLKENADIIEYADELQMKFIVPIKGTAAKAKVVMTVRIIEGD